MDNHTKQINNWRPGNDGNRRQWTVTKPPVYSTYKNCDVMPSIAAQESIVVMPRGRQSPRPAVPKTEASLWPEALFVIFIISLLVQLFPSFWWSVLTIIDVRGWTWRSWAVASAIWIVALVGLKARRDAAEDR